MKSPICGKNIQIKTLLIIATLIIFIISGCGSGEKLNSAFDIIPNTQTKIGWFWQNPKPQGNELNSVYFLDNIIGYAVGDAGTILKTMNSGNSWEFQSSGTNMEIRSIHCPVDANTCYAVGYGGTILKTTNGGSNWSSQTSGTGNSLNSIHCPTDMNICYVVGDHGTILKTTNGGEQ